MKTRVDQTFHVKSLDQLRAEITRHGLSLPLSEDLSVLAAPLDVGDRRLPNRLCVQPMEGCDARADGSPGRLTFRRYERYARGGYGLIWVEATAVVAEARSCPAQLHLHRGNAAQFAGLVTAIRAAARADGAGEVIVLLQLAHSGRYSSPDGESRPYLAYHNPALDRIHDIPSDYPLVPDGYLDELPEAYGVAADLAAEAGFDGVDVKSCYGDLPAELLAAFPREGRYGGSFENRTRLLCEAATEIRRRQPGLLLAARISVFDAVARPHGFGLDPDDAAKPDLAEPVKLVRLLQDAGLQLLSPSVGASAAPLDEEGPAEYPLMGVDRAVAIARGLQQAFPRMPVVFGGLSWLRQFVSYAAAGGVATGAGAMAGLGRLALAYPDAAIDILERGALNPARCCISCTACTQLLEDGAATGCVIRDNETYGADYRHRRRFAPDHLREEAERCHDCEGAPCTAACPAHIDVPAFVKAYADDDIPRSYEALRRSNVLPEMCSHLCPVWIQCEGACIENTLTGRPIPIRDIQYAVCWTARSEGRIALRLPATSSGKAVAIVGGGPAGVSCAVRLLEMGHRVTLFDRTGQLGGTPHHLIRSGRLPEVRAEIESILRPALDADRLTLRPGVELGRDVSLAELRSDYDAVLVAAGLWQEASLGGAAGVVDAVTFLSETKKGVRTTVPARVAVLAGGDCAVDVAAVVEALGCEDLYVVFGGSLADMHWHMPGDWFVTHRAHCLAMTQPLGYETNADGALTGVQVCRTEYGPVDAAGNRPLVPVPAGESVLGVDLVVEAMGLRVEDGLRRALAGIRFSENGLAETAAEDSFASGLEKVFIAGALVNGGASVVQCIAEGMRAAEEIDRYIAGTGSDPGGQV